MASGFSRYISDFEVEASLIRSKMNADIMETNIRRSRVEDNLASEEAMRRSRKQTANLASIQTELRKSHIKAQMEANRNKREEALRKSRVQAQNEANDAARNQILSNSRRETNVRGDKVSMALGKSKLETDVQSNRIRKELQALNDRTKRSKLSQQVESYLKQY